MNKILATANCITLIGVIYWNYYVALSGYNGNDVGELSDKYNSLFTPASYAFSIWGLIFLALTILTAFMIKKSFFDDNADDDFLTRTVGPALLVAILGTGVWTWVWLLEMTGLSVIIMLTILVSLLYLLKQIQYLRFNTWLVKVPIGIFAGWISVATIANISAHLNKTNWGDGFGEINWTIIMVIVAAIANVYVVKFKGSNAYGMAGIWALVAVSLRHWDLIPSIQWTALIGAALIGITIITTFVNKSKSLSPST